MQNLSNSRDKNARIPSKPWFWVGLVVVVGAAVWVWISGRPERHLAQAKSLISEGEPSEALAWLDLPESTPTTADRALILRARVAVEYHELGEAVNALNRVDPHGPEAADFAYWKGRTLYEASQPLLALNWFEIASNLRPDDADSARWVACAAYDLGDRSTTVRALEIVTRLAPEDSRVWRTLGTIFLENVEYEQARPAFERSLALDRAQPQVRLELAETLVKLGDADAAIRELGLCKGRVPEGHRAELLAESLLIKGDVDGFRLAITTGLASAADHPGLLTQQATLDLAEGRPELALSHLDRAVKADPYRTQTFYQRGLTLRRLGRVADSDRDSERVLALNQNLAAMSALNDQASENPHDPQIRYRLGQLCLDLGKPEIAASWFRATLACDPKHEAARQALSKLPSATTASGRGLAR